MNIPKFRKIPSQLYALCVKALTSLVHLDLEKKFIIVSIIVYTIVMSYYTIMRLYSLNSHAWDLGNYNQAMYTFVANGKLFELTTEILNNPSASLFGVHFSPIFFLQAPFYAILPRAETLLVLQSFVLALGVLPTFLISKLYFKTRKWQLLMCLAYLLNSALFGINVFDYHPELYISTFYLFIVYFYLKRNWLGFWAFSLLLMTTIEFAPTLLFVFGFYFILKDVIWPTYIRKQHSIDRNLSFNLIGLIIVSIVWVVCALRVIAYFSPDIPLLQGKTELWPVLDASNILDVPVKAITNPSQALTALASDGTAKMLYLLVSSMSWLLLPLLSIEFWVLSSSWLFPALLSNNVPFYTIGVQYSSFIVGQQTFCGISMISKFVKRTRLNWHIVGLFILLGLLLSNPFLSLNVATNEWSRYGLHSLGEKGEAVQDLLPLIPDSGSVLASSHIFPMVSSRPNAYAIPWQIDFNTVSFFNYVTETIDRVDYLFIDVDYWRPLTALVFSKTDGFGVLGYQDGIIILKRGYQDTPLVFKPDSQSFNYESLNLVSGSVVSDPSSQSSDVLMTPGDGENGYDFWWGPYAYIATPGNYNVTFWLKTNETTQDRIMTLDYSVFPVIVTGRTRGTDTIGYYQTVELANSSAEKRVFPGLTLYGDMLDAEKYTPITIEVIANISGIYEFRGMNITATVPVFLDRIDLNMTEVYSFSEPVLIQFNNYSPILFDQQHSSAILELGQLVDENATLLLQDELFPFIVHQNVTRLAVPKAMGNWHTSELDTLLKKADFVMLDWKTNITIADMILSHLSNSSDFGVYAFSDGVVLLKHDHAAAPVLFEPITYTFTVNDLIPLNGTHLVSDTVSSNSFVFLHNMTDIDFWWGPFANLFPGKYAVTYELRMPNVAENDSSILTLQINHFESEIVATVTNAEGVSFEINSTGVKTEIANKTVTIDDLASLTNYNDITIEFIADKLGTYEFPGRFVTTDSVILLNEITIELIEPYSYLLTPTD